MNCNSWPYLSFFYGLLVPTLCFSFIVLPIAFLFITSKEIKFRAFFRLIKKTDSIQKIFIFFIEKSLFAYICSLNIEDELKTLANVLILLLSYLVILKKLKAPFLVRWTYCLTRIIFLVGSYNTILLKLYFNEIASILCIILLFILKFLFYFTWISIRFKNWERFSKNFLVIILMRFWNKLFAQPQREMKKAVEAKFELKLRVLN